MFQFCIFACSLDFREKPLELFFQTESKKNFEKPKWKGKEKEE